MKRLFTPRSSKIVKLTINPNRNLNIGMNSYGNRIVFVEFYIILTQGVDRVVCAESAGTVERIKIKLYHIINNSWELI